jgi:hypothetical protein
LEKKWIIEVVYPTYIALENSITFWIEGTGGTAQLEKQKARLYRTFRRTISGNFGSFFPFVVDLTGSRLGPAALDSEKLGAIIARIVAMKSWHLRCK